MLRLVRHLDPRRSLAVAVGWLVIALSLVLALVAGVWLGALARSGLLQQHQQALASTADQLAAELDQALASRRQAIAAVADILGVDVGSDTPRVRHAMLEHLRLAYPEFGWIGLSDAEGLVVASSDGRFEGARVGERSWFTDGPNGAWIGDTDDAAASAEPRPPVGEASRAVYLAAPVRTMQGDIVGVLVAHLSLEWARKYTQGLRERLQLPGLVQTLVLDRNGQILIGPDSLEGKYWRSIFSDQAASSGARRASSKDGSQVVAAGFERLENGQSVQVVRARMAAVSALNRIGWEVRFIEPENPGFWRADGLWLRILWVSLGLGGVTALLGVLITRRLTRRLTRLTGSVEAVARGEAQHIELPQGSDEITRVATVFSEVLDALQRERGELRSLGTELERRVAVRTREIERLAAEMRYAAVVRERLNIARDLHDTLAHSMMAMLTEVRLLRKLHQHNPAALPDELAHAEQVAHQGLKEARDAIMQMRFNAVRDVGLGVALADAIRHFSERSGLAADYSRDPQAASLADERAETLFRMAEEVLRNVEQHAKASAVRVRLCDAADGHLELSIEDDGVGFDPHAPHPGHYGLVGLREQARLIGAELSISSTPHQGTRIRFGLRMTPDLQ